MVAMVTVSMDMKCVGHHDYSHLGDKRLGCHGYSHRRYEMRWWPCIRSSWRGNALVLIVKVVMDIICVGHHVSVVMEMIGVGRHG